MGGRAEVVLVLCNTASYSSSSLTFSLLLLMFCWFAGFDILPRAFSTWLLSCLLTEIFSEMLKTLLSLLPPAHISFLFTSSACTLLCFLSLPYGISHWKSLYMPKKVPWHQQYETQELERRRACSSLFLGTNKQAAVPRSNSSCGWFCISTVTIGLHLHLW